MAEARVDAKRTKAISNELEWIRQSPKGRQAKGKARVNAYESLVAEADAATKREGVIENIYIPPGPKLGDVVVRAENMAKYAGDRLLYDKVNFDLPRGGVIGVIGPNGVGKSTLLKMIVGQLQPDEGNLVVG